jgi:hypothetical protein
MRVRALTADYDYAFGQSAQNFLVDSPEAVGQIVETSMNLYYGEYYWDTTQGMPWFDGVIGKFSQNEADLTIQAFIASIPNVTSVTSFESTVEGRNYSATATIITPYGSTTVSFSRTIPTPQGDS